MSLGSRAASVVGALLARSAYAGSPSNAFLTIDSPLVERGRKALGGHLALRPEFQVEWLLQERTDAIEAAAAGDLRPAALLWKSILTDGTFSGCLNVRTAGTVSLPKRFRGNPSMISALELGHSSVSSVYDSMTPPDQAKLMIQDGIGLGVSVGELLPVPNRDYPVLRRLPPEGLKYRWASNQGNWFYSSTMGLIPITPGDGRWVLWQPGGTDAAPWERGAWIAASRAYILKEHCLLGSANFERSLANPAVLTTTPAGASELERDGWFTAFANWGINLVAAAPVPGYDAKLLEVTGTGYKAFQESIDRYNKELIISVAGQEVTTTGGTGFLNNNLFQSIKEDLIRETADSWAHLVNTQILPQWTISRYGLDALEGSPCVEYDARAPKDIAQVANSWASAAGAITALAEALEKHGREVDIDEVIVKLGLPVKTPAIKNRYTRILENIDEARSDLETDTDGVDSDSIDESTDGEAA